MGDSQRHKPISVASLNSVRDGHKPELHVPASAEATIKKTPLYVPSLTQHRDIPAVATKSEADAPAVKATEVKFKLASDFCRKSSDSQPDKPFTVTSLSYVADSSKAEPF